MIDALIAESDALLVRLEAETAQKKHFETELTASLTAYTDLFEDTQATIKQAVKDALDEYKTAELLKAMDQAETAAQVTSCDNP
jgi:vacuolar-type H+-ATPase subunit D/Vma8